MLVKYSSISSSVLGVAVAACAPTSAPPAPGPAEIRIDRAAYNDDGVPHFIRGALGRAPTTIATVADARSLDRVLPPIARAFQIEADELVPTRVERDDLGMTHIAYAQRVHGLRVVGGDLVVHLDRHNNVRSVNSTAKRTTIAPTPAITPQAATRTAIASTERGRSSVQTAPELVYVITARDSTMHLAWEVEATADVALVRDLVYVDALDGTVVERRPQIHTAKNRVVYDGNGGTYPLILSETEVGREGMPPQGDPVALGAYDNTGISYDCFKALYNRDSYDNEGTTLDSLVHVQFMSGFLGSSPNNAAWNGSRMIYGDGDGTTFAPFALALDVTTHELTHGVTTSTANLTYQGESGAINEALSDIMAAVCESWHAGAISANTWLIGETVFTPNTPNDALRYMANPTADASLYPPELGGSRDYYPERYTGSEDSGGVHLNSGIANLAFYLASQGGKHPRNKTPYMVYPIGIAKAGEIYYRALTMGYFTTNTNFAQARAELQEVASTVYPETEWVIATSYAAVGVGGPPPADDTPPTVTIDSPGDGNTVTPGFTVDVTATDDRIVTRVELAIDGVAAGSDDSAPYQFPTDPALGVGSHTIVATAFDAENMATASAMVVISSTEPDPDPMPDGGMPDPEPDPEDPGAADGGCCSTTNRDPLGALGGALVVGLLLRRRRRSAR